MENREPSPSRKGESPRPSTQRQRSNSFPIVEALGCSTPEAQLILAEGRAAVRKRRARGRRNRSFDDEDATTFRPKDHLKYLTSGTENELPEPHQDSRSGHARKSSTTTVRSTSTIVALPRDTEPHTNTSPTSPLGNYSAHLAQFIKAQLKSIPTYQPEHDCVKSLSPRSCPEFSFPLQTPPLSPIRPRSRLHEAPHAIHLPPIRPPMRSAFSAWSSADDDDDEVEEIAQSLPPVEHYTASIASKASNYTPSVLGYYEGSNSSSFLFSSTPIDDDERRDTAKGFGFPNKPAHPLCATESQDDEDYPSSYLSQPQLSTSSAPSSSLSSASGSAAASYFDCKRPLNIAPQLKNRIIAALTPPQAHAKIVTAISPWEGGAITNVHDVFVESQQRIHVDGMSFDMLRDFIVPSRVTTPC